MAALKIGFRRLTLSTQKRPVLTYVLFQTSYFFLFTPKLYISAPPGSCEPSDYFSTKFWALFNNSLTVICLKVMQETTRTQRISCKEQGQ